MLVRDSRKHQPEFDIAEARRIYTGGGWDEELEGEDITSPHDLFAVETLRDRFNLRVGRPVPADVFVFGKGQPPCPDCTHIGGEPFWPSGREWPADDEGTPYRFFARINFADSRDLVAGLPGDLLLLFIGDADDWYWEPMRTHFEWVSLGSRTSSDYDRSLIAKTKGPFFGAIFRTEDYPDAFRLARAPHVGRAYNLPNLYATKIGGVSHFIQNGGDIPGQFLCQIASIQAAPNVPFPWVNRAEPLGLMKDPDGIHADGNSMLFADMESIYIYRDGEGRMGSGFDVS